MRTHNRKQPPRATTAALAAFLLFAALLGVTRADASLPKSADVVGFSRPALQLPAVASSEPPRFGFAEDLALLAPESTPGRFGLFGPETCRFERTYARNNPLRYVDPDGNASLESVYQATKALVQGLLSPGARSVSRASDERAQTQRAAGGSASEFQNSQNIGGRAGDQFAEVGGAIAGGAAVVGMVVGEGKAIELAFKGTGIGGATLSFDKNGDIAVGGFSGFTVTSGLLKNTGPVK